MMQVVFVVHAKRVNVVVFVSCRAEEGVSQLNHDVTRKVAQLQRTVDEDEGQYKVRVSQSHMANC